MFRSESVSADENEINNVLRGVRVSPTILEMLENKPSGTVKIYSPKAFSLASDVCRRLIRLHKSPQSVNALVWLKEIETCIENLLQQLTEERIESAVVDKFQSLLNRYRQNFPVEDVQINAVGKLFRRFVTIIERHFFLDYLKVMESKIEAIVINLKLDKSSNTFWQSRQEKLNEHERAAIINWICEILKYIRDTEAQMDKHANKTTEVISRFVTFISGKELVTTVNKFLVVADFLNNILAKAHKTFSSAGLSRNVEQVCWVEVSNYINCQYAEFIKSEIGQCVDLKWYIDNDVKVSVAKKALYARFCVRLNAIEREKLYISNLKGKSAGDLIACFSEPSEFIRFYDGMEAAIDAVSPNDILSKVSAKMDVSDKSTVPSQVLKRR